MDGLEPAALEAQFREHFKDGRLAPYPLWDYWVGVDGKTGDLGYEWSDKPHRLVFDLLHHAVALEKALAARSVPEAGKAVTLRQLQAAHIERQAEWCPDQVPDLSFRGNEMAGEVGEACNIIKKLERERQGWRGSRATKEQLAEELGDVIHTAILCAITAGIDIEPATVAKFNSTSEKNGLSTFISALASAAATECATADCGKPATRYYSKFGVGSHHCEECYQRIVDLASSPQAVPAEDVAGLVGRLKEAESLLAGDYAYNHAATCREAAAALTASEAEATSLRRKLEEHRKALELARGRLSALEGFPYPIAKDYNRDIIEYIDGLSAGASE